MPRRSDARVTRIWRSGDSSRVPPDEFFQLAAWRRILRRMPRLQVYLPEDLYRAVKDGQLPASELLQGAVRAELRRRQILAETDRYLAELVDEVGEPSTAAVARAEAFSKRVRAKTESPKAS